MVLNRVDLVDAAIDRNDRGTCLLVDQEDQHQ
jgi:hypothetical protein